MTSLIKKDIATMKKTLIISTLTCIALIVYGIYKEAVYCIMMPIILNGISFGYDSRSKFEKFAFSMPIKKKDYVFSKLFFSFVFGILGAFACFIFMILQKSMPIENALVMSLLIFTSTVFMSSIQLPFVVKFGEEKGRLIIVVSYFLIFAASTFLKDKSEWLYKFFKVINKLSIFLIIVALIFIMVILITVLVSISIKILEKKEY